MEQHHGGSAASVLATNSRKLTVLMCPISSSTLLMLSLPSEGMTMSNTRIGRDQTWSTLLVSPSTQLSADITPVKALERLKTCHKISRTRFLLQASIIFCVSFMWMTGNSSFSPKALFTFCKRCKIGQWRKISGTIVVQETRFAPSASTVRRSQSSLILASDIWSAKIFMKFVRNRKVVRQVSYFRSRMMSYDSVSWATFSLSGRNHLCDMWIATSWQA
mmetsp:Transcript_103304/g.267406  ORF Transcript_103304/g.267406 Transcript_103304/m.267406 type:complete len:219 (+) Transcript_103304:11-667(+)